MSNDLSLFLTFSGEAEAAINFYAQNIPGAKIASLVYYGQNIPNTSELMSTKVLNGRLELKQSTIMFMDMDPAVPLEFSWASSIYLNCIDDAEFDTIFHALSEGGTIMMGPEAVGNFKKVAWVTDKFGVTWQPVLA